MIEYLNKLSNNEGKYFPFIKFHIFTTKITEKKLSFYYLSVELKLYKNKSV